MPCISENVTSKFSHSMFLVLKPNVERAFVPYAPNSTPQTIRRTACLNCRAKKLRCESQKKTCDQCNSKQLKCVYPRSGNYDSQRNRKTKRARTKSDVVAEVNGSSVAGKIRLETEGHAAETGSGSESTNSPPTNLIYEELLDQSDAFDFERYWEPLEACEIPGDSSMHLMNMDLDSSALLTSSSNSFTNEDEARHQDCQYDDFHLERNVSAGNPTSNCEKGLGQEMYPTNIIPNNAHDSLDFPIIPERTHLMSPVSESSQVGLRDSYQASRKQDPSSVSTSLTTCHCSSMVLETLKKVSKESSEGKAYQMHQALNMNKEILNHLSVGVTCQTCNHQSDLMMLITTTFEKAIDSFDRSLKRHRNSITRSEWQSLDLFFGQEDGPSWSEEATQLSPSSFEASQHDSGPDNLKMIYFGEYCVDQREEQLLLVAVLVKCQIRKLAQFHRKIQALATLRKWEMHRVLSEQVEQKIRALYLK